MMIDNSNVKFDYHDIFNSVNNPNYNARFGYSNYDEHVLISLSGEAVISGNGVTVTYNFVEMAQADEVDYIGAHVYRMQNEAWIICDGPNWKWD
jgi:hypothetical protein